MKKLFFLFIGLVTLEACDPDVPGEGVNLPEMKFGINISPNFSYLKIGDTITVTSSISNNLSGLIIDNGEAKIDFVAGYNTETPIISSSNHKTAINNEGFIIIELVGKVNIPPTSNRIAEISAKPIGDSIKVKFLFIPLKKGTYSFFVQSLFFEGTQGKTRTNPKFEVLNNHMDTLWKIPGSTLGPGDYGYDNRYLFAVTE